MKKILAILLILATLLIGCADAKVSSTGEYCSTYGFMNESQKKCDSMYYELSTGNVIWGVILFETVFAPIYFFGFSIYEPVANKVNPKRKN